MSRQQDYTVAQFIDETKAILGKQGDTREGIASIGKNLQRLSRRKDLLEQGREMPPGNGVRTRQLHLEPDNTLNLSMGLLRRDQPTIETSEMHSHGTWAVFCGYQGREWYGLWERVDKGERRGYADLRQLEYRLLVPGDLTIMYGPPADIHTHLPIEEDFWIIALFGNNAATATRYYFTPQWRVRQGVPGRYARTPGARLSRAQRPASRPEEGG